MPKSNLPISWAFGLRFHMLAIKSTEAVIGVLLYRLKVAGVEERLLFTIEM